ncbi:MAG TPA: hypothetical protein VMX17_00565 [Candidatus Glassbacteria bacterium]|nr:hypothetical protein [Candidatus Glassbacteria bacterium]
MSRKRESIVKKLSDTIAENKVLTNDINKLKETIKKLKSDIKILQENGKRPPLVVEPD